MRKLLHRGYRVGLVVTRLYCDTAKTVSGTAGSSPNKPLSKIQQLIMDMEKKSAEVPVRRVERRVAVESKYPAGVITLQVLGSGAPGSPSSLYIFADQHRYLFNCGEGSQRLAHEHRLKLSKLENVFVTSKQWSKVGGLPGMALTIQDIGAPVLTLHGPPGLEQLFTSTSRFIIMKKLIIKAADTLGSEGFEDHIMKVDYVPIYPSSPKSNSSSENGSNDGDGIELDPEEANIDYYSPREGFKRSLEVEVEAGSKKQRTDDDPSNLKKKFMDGNPYEPSVKCVMCFVCHMKPKEGKLLIEKCVAKGVTPGPLLGKLKAGQDITLPNGNVVLASEVRTNDEHSRPFIVVDCPSEEYIEELASHSSFAKYQTLDGNSDARTPSIIVHFTPQEIVLDPRYRDWMASFGPKTQHLLLNNASQSSGIESAQRIQYKLNMFDEAVFPLLKTGDRHRLPSLTVCEATGVLVGPRDKKVTHISASELPPALKDFKVPVTVGETLLKFSIRPEGGFDDSMVVGLCPMDYLREAEVMDGFSEELTRYKKTAATLDVSKQPYPEILFLGTGSSIPNKARNVSGILVNLSEDKRIMLDCGEGTYGQMHRFYGESEIHRVLSQTQAIYISHLHADHHLGLLQLLMARAKSFEHLNIPFEPVTLFAPHQILFWLRTYHHNFESIRKLFSIVANVALVQKYDGPHVPPHLPALLNSLELERIETCSVRHCLNSFGVAIRHKAGWKLTYSGDTQPCDELVKIGQGSDVCIHEATMEDGMEKDARNKQHSTLSQAIDIGRRMSAKYTILTHFSQRYAKVPKFDRELDPNVSFAFDNMRVTLADLPKIPLMYPGLVAMFQDYVDDMQLRTMKRNLREAEAEDVERKAQAIGNE